VFSSQVHTLCNYHAENNEVTLLCLCDKEELSAGELPGHKYRFFKTRRLPLTFMLWFNFLSTLMFRNYSLFLEAHVIHCRGPLAAAFAIFVCKYLKIKKPVIADMRGVMVNEIANSGRRLAKVFSWQAKKMEDYVFENANFFFFVSNNMREHYLKNYPHVANVNAVFPTIVDEKYFRRSTEWRNQKTKELNIIGSEVYVYCGGVAYWQNIDKIIDSFHGAWKQDNTIILLMLVKDQVSVNRIIDKLQINNPNIILYSVPYQEVGQYLNAADYGIIIRDDSLVNHVASPTKINEYLACGLKIIDRIEDIGIGEQVKPKTYSYTFLNDIINGQHKIYNKLTNFY